MEYAQSQNHAALLNGLKIQLSLIAPAVLMYMYEALLNFVPAAWITLRFVTIWTYAVFTFYV